MVWGYPFRLRQVFPATGHSPGSLLPNVSGAAIPLLGQGGVAAPLIKFREASLVGADGVVGSTTDDRWL